MPRLLHTSLLVLLTAAPACGQAVPGSPPRALTDSELGRLFSIVLDSASARTNAFRGWPEESIRLRLGASSGPGEQAFGPEVLEAVRARPDVVGVCTYGAPGCVGGDYVMLTTLGVPELGPGEGGTMSVRLSGDDGARGEPSVGFLIRWGVRLRWEGAWVVVGLDLELVSAP